MSRDSLDDTIVELTDDEVSALRAPYEGDGFTKAAAVKADEPAKADVSVVEKKADAKPARDVEFESLKARAERAEQAAAAERARRLEAEKRAHETAGKAAVADVHVVENQFSAVANALEKAKADSEAAKAAHKAALEAGDYAAATNAADQMATIKARMAQLEDGKAALEDKVAVVREAAKKLPDPPKDEVPSDPFERYVGQFGPREQAWLRAHPECVTDDIKNATVLLADKKARKEKIEPGSDAYFAFLDKELGYAQEGDPVDQDEPADDVVVDTKAKPAATPAKRVAAPVSRDQTITRTNDGKVQVRLTAAQRQMAEDLGMSATAYAKQLVALKTNENNPQYSGPRLGQYS